MTEAGCEAMVRVLGSGPVALAFAGFARRQGISRREIQVSRYDAPPPPALATRVLALSLGTWQLLSRIATMPMAAPIENVDVVVGGQPGRVRLRASQMGVPALGYVVRYADLIRALQHGVDALGVSQAPALEAGQDACPEALLVHAQGDFNETTLDELHFEQAALLAEVDFEHDPARREFGTAFERFTHNGPLALLPVPEPHRYSLVWCDRPERTRERADLPADLLAEQLQQAFGWQLGRIVRITRPSVAPMLRKARRELVRDNQVWIGNAAQALHPVAGQGLNLGLRDAFELARSIGDARAARAPLPDALARYARSRRLERGATIGITDSLARIFSIDALRPVQSLALSICDLLPPAREQLARYFMFGLR